MSTAIDMSAFAGTDPIFTIAEEVFSAMIDGEPGLLVPWPEGEVEQDDVMHAWVDVAGEHPGRVLFSTARSTALAITRALLAMEEGEPVGDADFVDALGEVANVVGGNVKALVPDPGALTLPQVTHAGPPPLEPERLLHETRMSWRGQMLAISLWSLS